MCFSKKEAKQQLSRYTCMYMYMYVHTCTYICMHTFIIKHVQSGGCVYQLCMSYSVYISNPLFLEPGITVIVGDNNYILL